MKELNLDKSKYAQKAMALFKEGYNCSQAVFLAFEEKYNLNHKNALMLSSSFGGGMGRLREVCGSVSGMFMVAGFLYGYDEPKNHEHKTAHYKRIQELAGEFEYYNGSIVWRYLVVDVWVRRQFGHDDYYCDGNYCLCIMVFWMDIFISFIDESVFS